MDFWDLTKLLYRRWYFALPGLVLTVLGVGWAFVAVSPNYIATAYVQLAPPISHPSQPGEQSLEQRNPWIGLGLDNLANAAILMVQQAAVVEAMKNSGYSDAFTATLTSTNPLVTFEVTGASEEQANATANQLVERFSQSIQDLQVTTYGVSKADLVTTRRLDLGSNLKQSNARVKRAAVAVGGAGLLFTIALTIGMDSVLRRRNRRAGLGDATAAPTDDLGAPVATARASRYGPQRSDYPATPSVGRLGRPDPGSAIRTSAGLPEESAPASPSIPTPHDAGAAGATHGSGSRGAGTHATGTHATGTHGAGTYGAGTYGAGTYGAGTYGAGAADAGTAHAATAAEQPIDGVVDAAETTEPDEVASPANAAVPSDSTLVLPLTLKSWRRRDSNGDEESHRR